MQQAELIGDDFTVSVTFRYDARTEDYRCNHLDLKVGDKCIVDTEHGPNIAVVARARMKAGGRYCRKRLRNVIRKATKYDLEKETRLRELEARIYSSARNRIRDAEMKMKLGHLEVTYDEKRVILHFTAENRVDFRDMVKSLASEFSVKVEMRQVGMRDEAKKLGGCGICGESLCCSRFLGEFVPVSIRMAKDQGLSLNPTKISGVCGRLMCCLNYENEFYKEMQKIVPKPGKAVFTPSGQGRVLASDYLRQKVVVDFGPDRDTEIFEAGEVSLVHKPQPQKEKPKSKKWERGGDRRDRGPQAPQSAAEQQDDTGEIGDDTDSFDNDTDGGNNGSNSGVQGG